MIVFDYRGMSYPINGMTSVVIRLNNSWIMITFIPIYLLCCGLVSGANLNRNVT